MQSKLVAVVLCVSVATSLGASLTNCADEEIPDYYLPVPSYSKFTRDITYEVLLKDTRADSLAPQKLLEGFDRLIETSSHPYHDRDFYQAMRNLANPGIRDCGWTLMNYIFEILTLAKEHPDAQVVTNYVSYVKLYGKIRLTKCFENIERQFDRALDAYRSYALDEFVAKYFDLKNLSQYKSNDAELYKWAKRLCLSKEDLRVARTLEVATYYRHRNYEKNASPLEIVQTFIGDACKRLDENEISNLLQIVNLGVALGVEIPNNFSVQYLKIIEYNHICAAWNKGDITRPGLQETPADEEKASVDAQKVGPKKWFKLFKYNNKV